MAGLPSVNKDFECPVCHEEYTEPKMLPCAHLACRKCVLALLEKEEELGGNGGGNGGGGCPLCKVPILSSKSSSQEDLDTLVDALPTDLATMTLMESQKVLVGQHICKVCENNVVATSFCLQCDAKLCRTCAKGHTKLPTLKHHVVEELSQLTAQRLAANYLSRCKVHDDRPAEVFCAAHFELICMLCATTKHRSCTEVKVIPEMAREKRVELKDEAERLREKEKALSLKVKEVKDKFKVLRKRVKDTFDDIQQCVKRRRMEMNGLIQAEEDVVMTSVAQMEKTRAAIKSNASTVESLVTTAPDVALLDMLSKLSSRLSELDQRGRSLADKASPVVEVTFEAAKLNHLKSVVSNIGRVTTKARLRHSHSAKSLVPAPSTS